MTVSFTLTSLISAGVNRKPPFPTAMVWTVGSEVLLGSSVLVAVAVGEDLGGSSACALTAVEKPARLKRRD